MGYMRVLVTGSNGLIGSALCKGLMPLGFEVLGIDNNLATIHPSYGDILDERNLFQLVDQVDGVIHLAAVSRVIWGEKNPKLCWKVNVEGTKNVVKAALTSRKQPWLIYASSREVYGQQDFCPVNESADLKPVNIYGQSKIEAEKIIHEASNKGLKTSIVRFSNVYGSVLDHHDRVIPAFCKAAAQGAPIRVDGSGNIFDFTYIEDVIQGLLSLVHLITVSSSSIPTVHLTSGKPTSLGQAAEIARRTSHHNIQIQEAPSRSFDVSKFWGDTTRARKILNWNPCVTIEEGIQRLTRQYQLFLQSFSTMNGRQTNLQ